MKKKLAILEGDGIGPEIIRESLKVLRSVEARFGHSFACTFAPFGASAYFSDGSAFPEETKAICDEADAIVKGPVGLAVAEMNRIPPEHRPEIGAILPLRKRYDTYANFRPVVLPPDLVHFSPLKREIVAGGVDILMIRELVGGIYFGNKTEGSATGGAFASEDCTYTRGQVERVAICAFEQAVRRKVALTNIHKANVLATSRFWNTVVEEVAQRYPSVPYQSVLVDNAAYQLMINPRQYNGVMLLENMMGDILSDQAGGVLGSLGLMPSACVGPHKVYVEPSHGSAPDIAGQDKANPYSMIGSVALMLELAFGLDAEAKAIWDALTGLFRDGMTTPELSRMSPAGAKVLSSSAFGDEVARRILS
jgi:3-isopropylmalate dehydrogenase